MADRLEVRDFLLEMKMSLALRQYRFVNRGKNTTSLAEMNMLSNEVASILKSIQVSDYCDGPLDDDKGRDERWWIFGPEHQGEAIYVKVSLITLKNGSLQVECLSFHKAERPLTYPLRP